MEIPRLASGSQAAGYLLFLQLLAPCQMREEDLSNLDHHLIGSVAFQSDWVGRHVETPGLQDIRALVDSMRAEIYAASSSESVLRSVAIPTRMRLFTVPGGMPCSSATCVDDRCPR